jgi:hypothetical protein
MCKTRGRIQNLDTNLIGIIKWKADPDPYRHQHVTDLHITVYCHAFFSLHYLTTR